MFFLSRIGLIAGESKNLIRLSKAIVKNAECYYHVIRLKKIKKPGLNPGLQNNFTDKISIVYIQQQQLQ